MFSCVLIGKRVPGISSEGCEISCGDVRSPDTVGSRDVSRECERYVFVCGLEGASEVRGGSRVVSAVSGRDFWSMLDDCGTSGNLV